MKSVNKTALVKVDFTLYKEVMEMVRSKNSSFPSIKSFVESAIKKQIETGGYSGMEKPVCEINGSGWEIQMSCMK